MNALAFKRVSEIFKSASSRVISAAVAAVLALVAFHLSLVATSTPLTTEERAAVERAIALLEKKGFQTEAFVLRNTATFSTTDNWLNRATEKEKAFAATNFPFQIITTYPDFYQRASDDTERAMILLHEARHMMAANEAEAHRYVWSHRRQLGWTQQTHGSTETFITVEQQTRAELPEMFKCSNRNWNDCTETFRARARH